MRALIVALGLALLTACASAPKLDSATQNATANYYARSLTVTQSSQFSTGLVPIGKVTGQELADKFAKEVQAKLSAEMPNLLRGAKPANVVVILQTASLASESGRVLLASDSYVDAILNIVDTETGATVAAIKIHAADMGARNNSSINGLPIGMLMSLAANASHSSEIERIGRLTAAFVAQAKRQLSN